jgi:uncharacterized protein YdhG (YjbR/CyaY superfamily)
MEKYHPSVASSDKSRVNAIYKSAPLPHRATMLSMRKTILEVIPNAEEVVSYGMPAFRVDGNIVAGLLHAKNHVGYYPFSGSVLKLFPTELKKFSKTKSAIHVPIDKPLSKTLIKKLIQARTSQCPVKTGKVDMAKYEKLDGYWKTLGIAAPARRGLIDNHILKLSDLKKWKESDFLKIHAMGPKATSIIKREMRRKKITFKR